MACLHTSICKVRWERHTNCLFLLPTGGALSGEWRPVSIWASVRCCCPSPQDRHDCIWHTGLRPDPQNQPFTPTAGVDQPACAGQRQERIWAHERIQVQQPLCSVQWAMSLYPSLWGILDILCSSLHPLLIIVDICHPPEHFVTETNLGLLLLIVQILGSSQCGTLIVHAKVNGWKIKTNNTQFVCW